MKKLLFIIFFYLLLYSNCIASPNGEKFTKYIYDVSNICINKGWIYYTSINKNLTFEEMGYSKSIENIINECLVSASDQFSKDKEFGKLLIKVFKKQNIIDYFYSIGMCNFSAGYSYARNNKGSHIPNNYKESFIDKCNTTFQHLINY